MFNGDEVFAVIKEYSLADLDKNKKYMFSVDENCESLTSCDVEEELSNYLDNYLDDNDFHKKFVPTIYVFEEDKSFKIDSVDVYNLMEDYLPFDDFPYKEVEEKLKPFNEWIEKRFPRRYNFVGKIKKEDYSDQWKKLVNKKR